MMQDEKLTFWGALLMPEQYFAHKFKKSTKSQKLPCTMNDIHKCSWAFEFPFESEEAYFRSLIEHINNSKLITPWRVINHATTRKKRPLKKGPLPYMCYQVNCCWGEWIYISSKGMWINYFLTISSSTNTQKRTCI